MDAVIVGAGFAGSILARKLAEDEDKKVLVLERRNHIGGNMYDFEEHRGIRIQKYGPHIFHTNNKEIYDLLCNYAVMEPYKLKCQVQMDKIYSPSPFNFTTIDLLYPEEKANLLKQKLQHQYKDKKCIPITVLLEEKDLDIREYAKYLYETDYKLYTAKQWGISPDKVDTSILQRVPVVLSYENSYFRDEYEALPAAGYTKLFQNLLSHPNIEVELNTDAKLNFKIDEKQNVIYYKGCQVPVIYTGAIDELFLYRFGKLPYRSLRFEFEYYDVDSYQQEAIISYPMEPGITRSTEYKKLPIQNIRDYTVVAYEYPIPYDNEIPGAEPYYPILTEESKKQYKKYLEYSRRFSNLFLCGRLADYRYYNMDQVIERALEVYKELAKE